MENKMRE